MACIQGAQVIPIRPTREQELERVLRSVILAARVYGEHLIPSVLAAAILAAEAKLKEMK